MRHTNLHTGVSPVPDPANAGGYLPIAEHGLIGDLHTVALVGTEGTIDWYCCPRFDAPSLFGTMLDRERGVEVEVVSARQGISAGAAPKKVS
jgi:GH15 family glucan-1,4-alpha-glucosidase